MRVDLIQRYNDCQSTCIMKDVHDWDAQDLSSPTAPFFWHVRFKVQMSDPLFEEFDAQLPIRCVLLPESHKECGSLTTAFDGHITNANQVREIEPYWRLINGPCHIVEMLFEGGHDLLNNITLLGFPVVPLEAE